MGTGRVDDGWGNAPRGIQESKVRIWKRFRFSFRILIAGFWILLLMETKWQNWR